MKTSRFLLLECYDPAYDYGSGEVISLDPGASYLLHKQNIPYRIPEDFYREKELIAGEEEYFYSQLKWFDNFDNFLKDKIPYCKQNSIALAKANYFCLKNLLDTVLIYSFILSRFFQGNENIKEIVYLHKPYREKSNYSIFELKSGNRKLFCDLLQLFCKKYNVHYTEHLAGEESVSQQKNSSGFLQPNDFLKAQVKKVTNFFKYKKFKNIFIPKDTFRGQKVLFLHAGSSDIDYPLKKLITHGAAVYLREKGKIIRENSFLRKVINTPKIDEDFLKKECNHCANDLKENSEIVSWVSAKCNIDVSSVILPFLRRFIAEDCLYMLRDAEKMFNFYKQNGINYCFARGNTDRNSLGPLIAAKYMKGAKSICTQHSSFAMDGYIYGVFETETYNYTLARDNISYDYFKHSVQERYKSDCKVFQAPYYLKSIKDKYHKKNVKNNKVVYVSKKFADRVRWLNNTFYSLPWYYEFQKEMIDLFAQETNLNFVYKHSQGQKWAEESILKYIDAKDSKNITIYTEHFLKALRFADRVIVDYPSTALFEAAMAGKPVLCVCADYLKIFDNAKDIFGKSIQQYASASEAVAIVKEFLHSPADEYKVDIPVSPEDFIETFKLITKG